MTQLDTGGVGLNAARIRALVEQFQPIHPIVIPQFQLLHFGIGLRAYLFGQIIEGLFMRGAGTALANDEEYLRKVLEDARRMADIACEVLNETRNITAGGAVAGDKGGGQR